MNFKRLLLLPFACLLFATEARPQTPEPESGPARHDADATPQNAGVNSCDASNYDQLSSKYFNPEMYVYLNADLFYYMTDEGEFIKLRGKEYPRNDETYQKFLVTYTEHYVEGLKNGREKFTDKDTLRVVFQPDQKMLDENPDDVRFQAFNVTYTHALQDGGVSEPDTLLAASKISKGKLELMFPLKNLPHQKVWIEIGCINRVDKDGKYYQIQWPLIERQRYIELDLSRR